MTWKLIKKVSHPHRMAFKNLITFSFLVYSELKATGKFEIMSQHVDEEEHSIEMHLPYIAKIMEEKKTAFTIVPVLVGATRGHKESEYGKIFSSYLADPENLFVISSDFCHWGMCMYSPSLDSITCMTIQGNGLGSQVMTSRKEQFMLPLRHWTEL